MGWFRILDISKLVMSEELKDVIWLSLIKEHSATLRSVARSTDLTIDQVYSLLDRNDLVWYTIPSSKLINLYLFTESSTMGKYLLFEERSKVLDIDKLSMLYLIQIVPDLVALPGGRHCNKDVSFLSSYFRSLKFVPAFRLFSSQLRL